MIMTGTGKMGQAMLSPLITQNLQSPSSMTVYDVSDAALRKVEELYPGVKASRNISDAIADSNLIVYGVKPQNVSIVHEEIRRAKMDSAGKVRDDAIILSVVAGTPIQSYVDGTSLTKVARSMPNTPAQIGCGVTVWSCTDNVNEHERERITAVLDSFGKTVFVEDESFIDMSTSISGSGPAYVFMLIEAMIDSGVHMGFSRETATTLVHHTLLGSTKFAMETGEHPAVLRNSVTSPAGTTASAIYELENGKFRTVVKDAIWACYRRSLEMGGKSSQVGPNRSPTIPVDVQVMMKNLEPLSHHPVEPPIGEMGVPSSFRNK
jgi:pyrroline-5-carboxylate reductase